MEENRTGRSIGDAIKAYNRAEDERLQELLAGPSPLPKKVEVVRLADEHNPDHVVFDAMFKGLPYEGIGLTETEALEALAALLGDAFLEMRGKNIEHTHTARVFRDRCRELNDRIESAVLVLEGKENP